MEDVLAGKYDVKKATAEYGQHQKDEAQLRVVWTALDSAMQRKDWDTATAKVSEAEKLLPDDQRDGLSMIRFHIMIGKKDYPAAYKLATQFSEAHKDNAMLQNELAWQIPTDETIADRNLDLAQTLATRANEAATDKEPVVLDTLARVQFLRGNKEEAIQSQEKALALAENDDMKAALQKELDSYKKGEVPKED